MSVVYIDTRPDWMKREDEYMKCFWECELFRYCQSKFGADCKRFGGNEIPKIRKK